MAGPPDAPLGVQLEHGPSPGIALISWLPVTIDAAGTSNGVRVTGYTIYADKKKVLEVSSPIAGSALLGPSQIQSLQAAQEVTVRTMSAHGESCDSFPVNVPSKLTSIMAGPAVTASIVPPLPCPPVGSSNLPSPLSYGNSAAKVSVLLSSLPSHTQMSGLTLETAANPPHALHSEDALPSASYVKAWANPSSASALAGCEATSPLESNVTPLIDVTSPTTSAPHSSPVAAPVPPQSTVTTAPAVLERRRDTDSPGTIRPFPSITEFIEDPSAKLGTPDRIPSPPKAPITDFLKPEDTNVLRPPCVSPLESEIDEEQENTRLVSIEEFLRQDPEPAYSRTQQSYSRGLVEPPSDYHADNNRSDLSDILEEEEEDLYSDHLSEAKARGYIVGADGSCKLLTPDSDEDVLERILKLPPQPCHNTQLFSIPELTEEEDSSQEEHLTHYSQPRSRTRHFHPRDSKHLHHAPQLHPNPAPHLLHQNHHLKRGARSLTKEPLPRHGSLQAKPKTQHRVHYADTVDPIGYPDDINLYEGLTTRRISTHSPSQPSPKIRDRGLLRGLGDRLRREAMLRNQMAVAVATKLGDGPTLPRPYPVSKTGRTLCSPLSHGAEIDVEYGTDDNEESVEYGPGEVGLEQMSSKWRVEGAQTEHRRPHHRGSTAEPSGPSQILPAETGPSWGDQAEISSKSACSQTRQPKGRMDSPKMKGDSNVRIFVALFPYDPASMSPNPDAGDEELPFTEGQIIKVHGDKDLDGFYRGEAGGRLGFVPCNMVSEIQVEDEETMQQLLHQGFLSTAASMEKIDPSQAAAAAPSPAGNPAPGARRMVAIFDYDPRESSPNTDIEAELTFSAGDIIHVFGDMDEDGFFYGDLNGHRGLVPSNFLQAISEDAPAESVSAPSAPEPKRESQKHKRSVHFEK